MNKYKKLLNNSVIFAVGSLGSKLIAILLVPLYTYALSTSQYGTVDLITTTVNMLLPIVSLSVFDAVLRFAIDKNEDSRIILSNAFLITVVGAMIMFLIFLILPIFKVKNVNIWFIFVLLISQAAQSMFSEFARASNHIRVFAFNGILGALITAIFNILFLFILKLGILGYLLSLILSAVGSIIYLFCRLRIFYIINLKYIDLLTIKRLLVYSIPLIPNALAWWATNASNRFFILYFVGVSANGLFAVANKIPSLLNMLNSIFFQSWQLSAIEEYDSIDKSNFYTKVFYHYSQLMFIGGSGLLLVLKPFMSVFVSNSFFNSWMLIPLLTLSVIYSCFSSFLGTNYIAAKKTFGIMLTTILGAILNIVFCLIFIPLIGPNGAGLASAISFFVIWIYRLIDTRRFVIIKLNMLNLLLNHLIYFIQVFILFNLNKNLIVTTLTELFLFLGILMVNKSLLQNMYNTYLRKNRN